MNLKSLDGIKAAATVPTARSALRTVSVAVAMVAAGIGGLHEIVKSDYNRTVRHDGFVSHQLRVCATGDDFWIATMHFDTRSHAPAGEVVSGRHFSPDEVDAAIVYGKDALPWVNGTAAASTVTIDRAEVV